ncbi:MAG: ABC transporter permease subunit [Candidatus Bipolaricaulota bacterium]|nr:MAG: ABC transporter permease subunit [Candidatus Bipolaricaulota bacterium]
MHNILVLLRKEWRESLRNKMVLFGALFLPAFMVGAALFMIVQGQGVDIPGAQAALFNTALMYFLVLPAVIPLAIAVYSIVGEKEQQSLEPLLATPVTDLELFLGKALASVIPALVITWASFGLFLGLSIPFAGGVPPHVLTIPWLAAIFGLTPLLSLTSVGITMIVSSRASDARAAYQFSSFAILPPIVPLIIYSTRKALVSVALVGVEGGVLIVAAVAVLAIAVRLFRREQILTRWK